MGGGLPERGMPRKVREEVAGGVFHVYARGNGKADIYVDDGDRQAYLQLLAAVVARFRWSCLAYCLMPNHVHLLVRTAEPNLGRGMQQLHGRYAQGFNRRHDRVGHVFQGRYGARTVASDEHLATAVAYVATNPVAAGLVDEPDAWPWGSHRAIARGSVPAWLAADELFALLRGAYGGDGRRRYEDLVAVRATGRTVIASDVVAGAGDGSVVR